MRRTTNVLVPCLLVCSLPALSGCTGQPASDSEVEQNTATIRAYVDASNRGDVGYLDEYLGPEYVYHGPEGDLDADGFKAFHEMMLSAFPGFTFEIQDLIAAGDKVATRWTAQGVQNGEFQGLPPTGKAVTITGIIISRFRDGRVVEEWEEANLLGLMQQLGAIAPPASGNR